MSDRARTVGRYEIERELGRGGMAVVHLARQIDLGRLVALKELAAFEASDPSFAQRFLREARVASALSHPSIVTVFDYFEEGGTPYIAMEFAERGSVRPFIRHLTLPQIGGVLDAVLAGLAEGERHGIVHRDLKPENLMVTHDGRVKIADYGIAKATSKVQTAGFRTATGMTVGTPGYMPPEQAMGKPLGAWTDLYALGCIAFELVIGHIPFAETESPMAIVIRHINEPVPRVLDVAPDVPPELAGWIDHLVVKDPAARPACARAAADQLESFLIEQFGPRWRRVAGLEDAPVADAPSLASTPTTRSAIVPMPGPYTPPPPRLLSPERQASAPLARAARDSDFVTYSAPPVEGPPDEPSAAATSEAVDQQKEDQAAIPARDQPVARSSGPPLDSSDRQHRPVDAGDELAALNPEQSERDGLATIDAQQSEPQPNQDAQEEAVRRTEAQTRDDRAAGRSAVRSGLRRSRLLAGAALAALAAVGVVLVVALLAGGGQPRTVSRGVHELAAILNFSAQGSKWSKKGNYAAALHNRAEVRKRLANFTPAKQLSEAVATLNQVTSMAIEYNRLRLEGQGARATALNRRADILRHRFMDRFNPFAQRYLGRTYRLGEF